MEQQELLRKGGVLTFHGWRGPQTPGRHVKEGLLPPPIVIRGIPYWVRSEIEAVRDARLRGADDDTIRELVQRIITARVSTEPVELVA